MKRKILFIQLLMIGLLFTTTNSCKKDEPIIKKDVVLTWDNPIDIVVGTVLSTTQLNAKADVPGNFVYIPPIGTLLIIGTAQDLKVDFTPIDVANYNVASKTVKINVLSKKDPVITWANPADIFPETQLSTTQLNATADVAGSFIYTPSIGTVLNMGASQVLKVDFTPMDGANYNVASKTVMINVRLGVSSVVFNPSLTYGTITDQEGNTYKTITIGLQTWMAENLRVTKYRNGDPIPYVTDNATWSALTTGAYCNYENNADIDKITTYGRLYNWFAIADSRNIAPIGWHVPTDAEWTTLTTYLGGISVAGGKMKETGTTHWFSPNLSATNESGFSATPIGNHGFGHGYFVQYWSSTQGGSSSAWGRGLDYDKANCSNLSTDKSNSFAIRLVKD